MDNNGLTTKHVLPAFIVLALFALMAWRGEAAPTEWSPRKAEWDTG